MVKSSHSNQIVICVLSFSAMMFSPAMHGQEATRQDGVGNTNINRNADTGQKQQSSGAGINAAVSAAMAIPCATVKPPGNIPFCIMSMLAAMQSGADSGYAGESGNVEFATNFDTGGDSAGGDRVGGDEASLVNVAKVDKIKGELAELGYGYDDKTNSVTLPDGSSIPASAASSPSSLASFGLDRGSVDEAFELAQKTAEKEKEDFNVVAMDVGTDGGGGGAGGFGGGGAANGNGGDTDFDGAFNNLMNRYAVKRKPATAKGFSRRLAEGQSIGVSQDNIFDMIHRRYQKKRKTRVFIERAKL